MDVVTQAKQKNTPYGFCHLILKTEPDRREIFCHNCLYFTVAVVGSLLTLFLPNWLGYGKILKLG